MSSADLTFSHHMPTNPFVVYLGGSENYGQLGDPPAHGFLRVNTQDMRDTTYFDPVTKNVPNDGDDIQSVLTFRNGFPDGAASMS